MGDAKSETGYQPGDNKPEPVAAPADPAGVSSDATACPTCGHSWPSAEAMAVHLDRQGRCWWPHKDGTRAN